MKEIDIIEQAQYYIWWLKKCSSKVSPSTIARQAHGLLNELNKLYTEVGYDCDEYITLKEFESFGCSPGYWSYAASMKAYVASMERSVERQYFSNYN